MPAEETRVLLAELTADLVVEKLAESLTKGVFIEHLPPIDVPHFLKRISEQRVGISQEVTRVAILGHDGDVRSREPLLEVSTQTTDAHDWRNSGSNRDSPKFVVLVIQNVATLDSLRTSLRLITPTDVRKVVCERGTELCAMSVGRVALWKVFHKDAGNFSLRSLLQYVAALETSRQSPAAILEKQVSHLFLLGLLREERLFHEKGRRKTERFVQQNLSFVQKMRPLTSKNHKRVVAVVGNEGHALQKCARYILTYSETGLKGDLEPLSADEVRKVLKAPKRVIDPRSKRPERVGGNQLAIERVIDHNGKDLERIQKHYKKEVTGERDGEDEPEPISVDDTPRKPRHLPGTAQALAFFREMLSEERWGGLVQAKKAKDFVSALRLLATEDVGRQYFEPGGQENVRGMLNRAVDIKIVDPSVLAAWDRYAKARAELLPEKAVLIDHALLALSGTAADAQNLKKKVEEVLDAYREALQGVLDAEKGLREQGSRDPARRLLGKMLVLDLVFVNTEDGMTAIAAPTHPFHLWRWLTLADFLEKDQDELRVLGSEYLSGVVQDPPASLPPVVLSPFALPDVVPHALAFVCTGGFAGLPIFREPTASNMGYFSAKAIARISTHLLRIMPHAGFGLRVILVDPPSVATITEALQVLRDPFHSDQFVPIYVTVYYSRPFQEPTEEEDEDLADMAQRFMDRGGEVQIRREEQSLASITEGLKKRAAHLVVLFEPGENTEFHLNLATPPSLTPLAVPRTYKYDQFDDRIDVVIGGTDQAFLNYRDLMCNALDVPMEDFVGRRSGASALQSEIEAISKCALWVTLIDRTIEPTLRIGTSVRVDWRNDSGRDLVTFTSYPETLLELVRHVVNAGGLAANDLTTRRTFNQVCRLSGEALLSLAASDKSSTAVDQKMARGTLGLLAAARWYERRHPGSLLVSLDAQESRAWILGVDSQDEVRGDLLGIRNSDEGSVIDVMEVKAHQHHDAAVRNKAMKQVERTIEKVARIVTPNARTGLNVARYEILKDHLYRAVASRPYEPEERSRLVNLLEELFQTGPTEMNGLVCFVDVCSNTEIVMPDGPTEFVTGETGKEIGIVEIVESEAVGGESDREVVGREPDITPPPGPREPDTESDEVSPPPEQLRQLSGDAERENVTELQPPTAEGRFKWLIGSSFSNEEAFWDPMHPEHPLNNFGMLATGDSGSGKTQLLRALIADLSARNIPVCVFDFKNDYAPPEFSVPTCLKVFDVNRNGLPINPLALVAGNDRGEQQPIRQIHEVAGILGRIYGLGTQQRAGLRDALKEAYEANEIDVSSWVNLTEIKEEQYPDFNQVAALLRADRGHANLLNRLDPLLDLGLFPSASSVVVTLEEHLTQPVVLDLHALPSDNIKATLAEFVIVQLHGYLLKQKQPRLLRRMLFFDEAWRVAQSEKLVNLAREGRAFGVGLAIATQFPKDIPTTLSGNLATKIFLLNQEHEHRSTVARSIIGAVHTAAGQSLMAKLTALKTHEAVVSNQQFSPYQFIRSKPHFERVMDSSSNEE